MVGFKKGSRLEREAPALIAVLNGKDPKDYFDKLQMKRNYQFPLVVFLSGSFHDNARDFDKYEGLIKALGMCVHRMDKYWKEHPDEVKDIQDCYGSDDKLPYWRKDLEFLGMSDVLVMLPGWRKHPGCCMEYGYAKGKHIFTIEL